MEHAELISGALSYIKETYFRLSAAPMWVKLFLYIIIPILGGIAAATILLQVIIKPLIIPILISPDTGFTEAGLTGILQYIAVLMGFACVFFVPLFQGYLYRIMRSGGSPDTDNRWSLFFSGWRINLVLIYYAIPLIVIFLIYTIIFTYIKGAVSVYTHMTAVIDVVTTFSYVAIEFVTFIFVGLFAFIGIVHLARSGSLREAVSMNLMASIIKRIGWYDYILCIVIMTIMFLVLSVIFLSFSSLFNYNLAANIIFIGIYLFLMVPLATFFVQYISEVYDTAFIIQEDDNEEFDDF